MTKADLIEEVSRVVEMTRKESEVIVEAIFDSIVKSLRSGDKIEIRPMMYVALTYDHRIIDGREAVTFLVRIKECVEDPSRLLFDI